MTPGPFVEAPWLCPEQRDLAVTLLHSHQRAFDRPLWAHGADDDSQHLAQELFTATTVILAHDGTDPGGDPGPRLIYANRAALQLWQRRWEDLVGMPSRLTAEPQERPGRARMLVSAREQHAFAGYSGIRINSLGRRFQIRGARLWTLYNRAGQPCGQAAAFSDWWWL